MSLFDQLKRTAKSTITDGVKDISNKAVNNAANKSETFTFTQLPQNLEQLKALPEAKLQTPFQTAALTVVALCRYKENVDECIEMLNFLKGPGSVSQYEIQFLRDRLIGKEYKPFSFFEGANPQNNYTPEQPFKITVYENPYSYPQDGWATLWVQSGGADSKREIKLRNKPSTGEWFMVDNLILGDIRTPVEADPWA